MRISYMYYLLKENYRALDEVIISDEKRNNVNYMSIPREIEQRNR